MKQMTLLMLIAFVFLSSTCKKAMQVPDPELKKIFGKWEWVSTTGGIAGMTITPLSAGHTIRLEFKSDGTYLIYENDSLVNTTRFSFSQSTSIHNRKPVWLLSFAETPASSNEKSVPISVSFSGQDTLLLNEQVHDG